MEGGGTRERGEKRHWKGVTWEREINGDGRGKHGREETWEGGHMEYERHRREETWEREAMGDMGE